MTLSYTQRKAVYDFIPKKYDIPVKDDNVLQNLLVTVMYENQKQWDVYPRIVLGYRTTGTPRKSNPPLGFLRAQEKYTTDEQHIYRTGTDKYVLDVEKASSITKVWGTVSGSKHIFTASQYQLLTSTNEIEFITATKPDANTIFYVTYNHKTVRIRRGQELYDTLTVTIYARDYRDEDRKIFANGTLIAESIADALKQQFDYYFDDQLESTYNMCVIETTPTRDIDVLSEGEGEIDRKRRFEVNIAHVEEVTSLVESIETAEIDSITVNT